MKSARAAAVVALLAGAAAGIPVMVAESEPNGFTTPAPQSLGILGPDGITVTGALSATSPTGLAPGDDDGYSFTPAADGPFRAVVDDGAGATFVLGLAEQAEGGPVLLAAVIGPAPLALSRPALKAGTVYRVGVAALGDGSALPYTLALDGTNAVPPWTGQPCDGTVAEVEPNADALTATDLGWFDRSLCGSGSLATVAPLGSEEPGEIDTFRFRNVLPVTATLNVSADPGTIDLEVAQLSFVGTFPVASATFGSGTVLGLPKLEPGADYLVSVSGRSGTTPLNYSFFLEPVGPPSKPAQEPMDIVKATLRLGPDARRSRFSLVGAFDSGLGAGLEDGVPMDFFLRGGETTLGSGSLVLDDLGRLLWKAPKGYDGIRSFVFDPFLGSVTVKGRGVDLRGSVDPEDPAIFVDLDFGAFRLGTTEDGVFNRNRRVLKVK